MSLQIPRQRIEDFEHYRQWLCESGIKYYEEVWPAKKKPACLQEYVAICYAKNSDIKIRPEDGRTFEYLASKN